MTIKEIRIQEALGTLAPHRLSSKDLVTLYQYHTRAEWGPRRILQYLKQRIMMNLHYEYCSAMLWWHQNLYNERGRYYYQYGPGASDSKR